MSHHLRDNVAPSTIGQSDLHVYLRGLAAGNIDFSTVIGPRLPLFLGAVLGLSFLLLLVVFRSVLVPVKAVLMMNCFRRTTNAPGTTNRSEHRPRRNGSSHHSCGPQHDRVRQLRSVRHWCDEMIGLGSAVALAVDATIVRIILTGDDGTARSGKRWLPSWLDRLLPRIDVEGGHLDATTGQADVAKERGDRELAVPVRR